MLPLLVSLKTQKVVMQKKVLPKFVNPNMYLDNQKECGL